MMKITRISFLSTTTGVGEFVGQETFYLCIRYILFGCRYKIWMQELTDTEREIKRFKSHGEFKGAY